MNDKVCTGCSKTKSHIEFYKNGIRLDAECKECRLERSRKYYAENSDQQNTKKRNHRKSNPQKYREYEVRRAYGLTPTEYYGILESQNNSCAGCKVEFSDEILPYIDHDHACCPQSRSTCGHCTRGALCNACNRGLGSLKDSVSTLRALIEYLITHQEERCE